MMRHSCRDLGFVLALEYVLEMLLLAIAFHVR